MPQPRANRHVSFPGVCVVAPVLATLLVACNPPTVSTGQGGTDPARNAGNGGQASGGRSGSGGPGEQPSLSIPDAASTGADMSPAAPTSCAAEAHKAEAVPLDLMLLVDASGSMGELVGRGMPSKWTLSQGALTSFLQDPKTAGLGIGLSFFPKPKECNIDADCGGSIFNRCRGADRCVDAMGAGTNACYQNLIGFPTCPAGSQCVALGTCTTSMMECVNVGQPCPMNGGACMPATKFCESNTPAAECAPAGYEIPAVAIGELPGSQTGLLRALTAKVPRGGTPMRAAVEGALKHLRAHLEKNPGRKAVLVLASDGLPSCDPTTDGIPAVVELVRMAQMAAPSIATYVVGVFAPAEIPRAQPQLDMVAMAGGSNQAFVVSANSDLAMRLQEALDTIRGAALACDFTIPPPKDGMLDFSKVNVRYTPTGGAAGELPYVRSMAGCDPTRGGWYYDVDPAMGKPTRVLVCPSTCQQFKKDGSAKVDLLFGCATRSID
jgi:Mg-chelatase subunit ChlD